jgi:hypothetical protein
VVTLNAFSLRFIHGILFMRNEAMLFLAREEQSGRIHLFFIPANNHAVFRRNGLTRRWEKIDDMATATIINLIQVAQQKGLMVIKTQEDYEPLLGHIET